MIVIKSECAIACISTILEVLAQHVIQNDGAIFRSFYNFDKNKKDQAKKRLIQRLDKPENTFNNTPETTAI